MRLFKPIAFGMLMMCSLAGVGMVLLAQSMMKPGHDRVPPFREPSPYMSAAEIQAAFNKLDPKLVASRTGGAVDFADGKTHGVGRRPMSGPPSGLNRTRNPGYVL